MSRFAYSAIEKYIAPGTVALFLALQGADRTLAIGWAVLTMGGFAAALCGAVDFQRPLSSTEKGMGVALAGWALSVAFGLDPARSLLLSVPMLASILVWVLITRDRYAQFGFLPVATGLGIAAAVQSMLLVAAALRYPGMTPADWVVDAGSAWLVVPNDIAWMACVLPLLAIIPRHRTLTTLFTLLLAFLALCAITRSRTAAVVAVAVALAFVASTSRFARSPPSMRRWMIAAAGAALAVLAASGVASMRSRLQLWAAAWSTFLDHPWTGVGIHNFVIVYRQYPPAHAAMIDPRITPWPHNLILEIVAEWGLIGAIAILLLAGCLVRRGHMLGRATLIPMHRAALAGLIGMALLALVEASLLRQWVWLLGTALCALIAIDVEPHVHGRGNNETPSMDEAATTKPLRSIARR